MSAVTETITVVVGSGAALATLAAALRAWGTRNKRAVIRIVSGDRTVVIDTSNVNSEDLVRILQDITKDIEENKPEPPPVDDTTAD
jgi:CRISPR/Cas system-associated exonuclease Cas4 (RecB family)